MTTTSLSAPSGTRALQPGFAASARVSLAREALFVALHVPLAFALKASPLLATGHALLTLMVGVVLTLRAKSALATAYVSAYIVGAEILWRGSHASVFWEMAKYSVLFLILLALLRFSAFASVKKAGLLYAIAMLPSFLVLPYFDRTEISFAVSGSFTMGLVIAFFSQARFTRIQIVRLFMLALGPLVGLAALSTFSTVITDPATFWVGGKVTTAGIGPNQASSALGLGMLLSTYLFFLLARSHPGLSRLALLTGVWMGIQALLSFSRGGIWGTLGTLAVATWFLVRSKRARQSLIAAVIVVVPILQFWLLPAIDNYTRGIALARFQQTELTGRDRIMASDLRAFREHPILGLGPGQSDHWHRIDIGREASPHTEYTRLLAEHGSFGILAILILLGLILSRWRDSTGPVETSLRMALSAWTILYMGHSAMRLVAPGFVFGLGGAHFDLDEPGSPPETKATNP